MQHGRENATRAAHLWVKGGVRVCVWAGAPVHQSLHRHCDCRLLLTRQQVLHACNDRVGLKAVGWEVLQVCCLAGAGGSADWCTAGVVHACKLAKGGKLQAACHCTPRPQRATARLGRSVPGAPLVSEERPCPKVVPSRLVSWLWAAPPKPLSPSGTEALPGCGAAGARREIGEWWDAWLGTHEGSVARGNGGGMRAIRLGAAALTARPQVVEPRNTPPCLVAPLPPSRLTCCLPVRLRRRMRLA